MKLPAPQSTWQVPRSWQGWEKRAIAASLYGFGLGAGVLTRITSSLYPVIVWVALASRPAQSALVMGCFGLFRAVPLWSIYAACANANQRDVCTYVLHEWHAASRLLNWMAMAPLGAALLLRGVF
ncbi:MAG: hypothetical protein LAP87_10785 [Acidobacteriia bacterium]|nr:hypothetical protein [Terriglobia bacterium]